MIVVSDASSLIAVGAVGQVELLRLLYGEVLVPEAVWAEVLHEGRPGSAELASAPWLRVATVQDRVLVHELRGRVGDGEAEAIALAHETNADTVLIDERLARRIALTRGLPVTGLLGLLVEAKAQGLIPAIGPIIDQLRTLITFRLKESLYEAVLREAGEL